MIQHVKNNRTAISRADQCAGAPLWRSTSLGCLPTSFMNASKIEPSLSGRRRQNTKGMNFFVRRRYSA